MLDSPLSSTSARMERRSQAQHRPPSAVLNSSVALDARLSIQPTSHRHSLVRQAPRKQTRTRPLRTNLERHYHTHKNSKLTVQNAWAQSWAESQAALRVAVRHRVEHKMTMSIGRSLLPAPAPVASSPRVAANNIEGGHQKMGVLSPKAAAVYIPEEGG